MKKIKKEGTPKAFQVEESLRKRFKKEIFSKFCKAINEYNLIAPNDKIAVCISGGKDSFLMAKLFQELKRHNKFPFEVVFLCMDPGYNAKNRALIENNAKMLEIPLTIFNSNIFENVVNIEKSPCYICARMRRGHLYAKAKELGCNKIALGHHYDDVIETILMGLLYSGQFQTMLPKLKSKNFEGMELIRPMYLIREDDIKHFVKYNELTFLQCACKFTESESATENQSNTADKLTNEYLKTNKTGLNKANLAEIKTQSSNNKFNEENAAAHGELGMRKRVKNLIAELKAENPLIEANIFKSVENVNLNTLISYKDKSNTLHRFDEDF